MKNIFKFPKKSLLLFQEFGKYQAYIGSKIQFRLLTLKTKNLNKMSDHLRNWYRISPLPTCAHGRKDRRRSSQVLLEKYNIIILVMFIEERNFVWNIREMYSYDKESPSSFKNIKIIRKWNAFISVSGRYKLFANLSAFSKYMFPILCKNIIQFFLLMLFRKKYMLKQFRKQ